MTLAFETITERNGMTMAEFRDARDPQKKIRMNKACLLFWTALRHFEGRPVFDEQAGLKAMIRNEARA